MTNPDLYAVMGNPIGHSKSPRIHTLFAEQTEQTLTYSAILVERGAFTAAVNDFRRGGGKGLNVTVPFKQDAWALAGQRTPRAELAKAVNTLLLDMDGSIVGDNTDGVGFIRDVTANHGIDVTGKRVLLLGAGGAARGIIEPILEQNPGLLIVANRTSEKAVELARNFCTLGKIEGCGLPDLKDQSFEIVINATAAGLENSVPDLPDGVLADNAWCYDLMYSDKPTAFVIWAMQQGAKEAVDGLGMLVEQAAESFFLWRGVRPETKPVIAALRAQ